MKYEKCEKNEIDKISNLSFREKIGLAYINLLSIIKGENIFDLFWPD